VYPITTAHSQKELLEVASKLNKLLEEKGYTAPKDITHCGKRKCSVGKLKGRAEEARKAEMFGASCFTRAVLLSKAW
jgi:hypothetical protein